MFVFSLTIFWGAFLLFVVQPLVAKFILPWFGGGAAVWTTCVLFFQVLLLGGYCYAHFSVRKLSPRGQVWLHIALLAISLLFLPIQPSESWKPADSALPAWRILLLLSATIGLPYLTLSATGPLIQAWFSRADPTTSPYRLYALSNVGSLLALVSYPAFFERNLSRGAQAGLWSIGLVGFALLILGCGITLLKRSPEASTSSDNAVQQVSSGPDNSPAKWLWFALPACASVLLLAVTNKICQDIAVIPFLWVVPLIAYLLSFIISFDSPRWYRRAFWAPAFILAISAILWVMLSNSVQPPRDPRLSWLKWLVVKGVNLPMLYEIAIYVTALFVCCMVCHGEVYRLRPNARQLSGYYLLISAGGAFGGLFVAVVAPLVFKHYFELHLGILAAGILFAAAQFSDPNNRLYRGKPRSVWSLITLLLCGIGFGLYEDAARIGRDAIELSRSFYGVLKVYEPEVTDPQLRKVFLLHGGTTHGFQFVASAKQMTPTTYYAKSSGIGITMLNFPRHESRRIGVVGLGTGTMAAYGKPGDYFRFYEIDSNVQRVARTRFSFLNNSPAKIDIVLGDARLSMERENDEPFDILVLDAFSSDAIPVHLLTREALQIYLRRLKPDGVIAVHISNRYLNLEPIVLRLADQMKLDRTIISNYGSELGDEDTDDGTYGSDWVLLSNNQEFLKRQEVITASSQPGKDIPEAKMWTDDEINLLPILDYGN